METGHFLRPSINKFAYCRYLKWKVGGGEVAILPSQKLCGSQTNKAKQVQIKQKCLGSVRVAGAS